MKPKKIVTVIGARPQFIKASAVSAVVAEYEDAVVLEPLCVFAVA